MKELDINGLIAKNLRRLREQNRLSQVDLATMINISGSQISAIENGRVAMGKDYMERICRALNVRPWELLIEESTPVVGNIQEQQHLELLRQARELGANVAEEVIRYERLRIEDEKRQRAGSVDERHRKAIETLKHRKKRKQTA